MIHLDSRKIQKIYIEKKKRKELFELVSRDCK